MESQETQYDTQNGKCFGAEVKEMTDQVEKAVFRAKAAVSDKIGAVSGRIGAMSDKIGDGRIAAERMLKRGRYAMEDGVDTAVRQVKRNPVRSVLVAFAAGAMVGLLAPHLGRRNRA